MKNILVWFLGITLLVGCSSTSNVSKDKKVSVGEEKIVVPIIDKAIGNITYDVPEIIVLPSDLQIELGIEDAPGDVKHYLFKFPYEVTGNTTNTGEDMFNLSVMNEDEIVFSFTPNNDYDNSILETYSGERLYYEFMDTPPATKSSRFEVFTIADKFVEAGGEWDLIFKRPIGTIKGIKPLGKVFE